MNTNSLIGVVMAALLLFAAVGCDEGIDDWSSSAKISGYVYADAAHAVPLRGVQVIIESDIAADNPYNGPDRWFTTNSNGYFEGYIHLGYDHGDSNYVYLGDVDVAYFLHTWYFRWGGGITVAPGSHFTLPAVDSVQYIGVGGG